MPINKDIKQFEPKNIMKYFEEITKIPHGSHNEEKIANFLYDFFKKLGAEVYKDNYNNIIARKKATPGYENLPMVTFQGHIDMVNVKENDSNHDFSKDPLDIYEEDGYIKANKTSLGADNGMAIACIMELFANEKIIHGPIEAILTTDEEDTMSGVNALDFSNIKGKYLINMDSEADDLLYIGCVGGGRIIGEIDFNYDSISNDKVICELKLENCIGGHSGWEIYQKKINAIKESFTILYLINEITDVNLISVNGGSFDNVIAQNCITKFAIDSSKFDQVNQLIIEREKLLKNEFKEIENKFSLSIDKLPFEGLAISSIESKKIINVINSSFNGLSIYDFEYDVPNTSSNLGVISTKDNKITVRYYSRSPLKISYQRIANQIRSSFALGNYKTTFCNEMPGWLPDFENNKLAKQVKDLYKKMFNEDFKIGVMAGGVEVAIILEKHYADCISLGFKMFDIHSPKERVSIASVQKIWNFLLELLKTIK